MSTYPSFRQLPLRNRLITPKVAGDLAAFLEWTDSVRDGASRDGLAGFDIRTIARLAAAHAVLGISP